MNIRKKNIIKEFLQVMGTRDGSPVLFRSHLFSIPLRPWEPRPFVPREEVRRHYDGSFRVTVSFSLSRLTSDRKGRCIT